MDMVEFYGDLLAGSAETDVTRAMRAEGATGTIRYSREAALRRTAEEFGVDVEVVRTEVETVELEELRLSELAHRAREERSAAARRGEGR